MNNNKNTLVLFDVGAVLLELKYENVYKEGAKISGRPVEEYKKLSSELEVAVLNGVISYEEHQIKIKELLKQPNMNRNELESFVKKAWGKEITPVVNLKEKIYYDANCPVNIFSNIDRFGFEIVSRIYPRMMQTFRPDAIPICSYLSKGTKPHKINMYNDGKISAEKLGCSRVILIDDKESILQKGIDEFGWYGIHFTPYIDKQEGIRIPSSVETPFSSDKLFVANSVNELEQGLREFGVKI